MDIHGFVAPGFEPVRDTMAAAADFGEGGAAYAAYHRGELVVDLWAGTSDGAPWDRDTRGCWMSVTKSITTLCLQILVDRGLLDVDQPVATCWPEFGQAGKEAITVRDVATHASGTVGAPDLSDLVSLDDGTGLDQEADIVAIIEQAPPAWEPGTKVGYQAVTFGPILGEVIRRVSGRRLGTFLREEVAEPLGVPDVRIGTPVEEHHLIAPMHKTMFPDKMPDVAREYWETVLAGARVAGSLAGLACLAQDGVSVLDRLPEIFDTVPGRTAELGGSNMVGTARGVARILAALVEPDGLDGVTLVSPDTFNAFAEVQRTDVDEVLLLPIPRATGHWRNIQLVPERPRAYGPNEETVGHTGMGGQIGYADPVDRVAVAMVRSHHTAFPMSALLLNQALYSCTDQLKDA